MCGADMQRLGALYWCVCAPKEACGTCRHCKEAIWTHVFIT